MYDRESAAWARRRDEPQHRALVERTADELARVVAPPGPVADLGCGPGAHALALARRGYDVVGAIVDTYTAGTHPPGHRPWSPARRGNTPARAGTTAGLRMSP